MRQLIKVCVELEKIEKPLDEPRRRKFALGSVAAGLASASLATACMICQPGLSGLAFSLTGIATLLCLFLPLALVREEPLTFLLPPAARRFRRATRAERAELVRRTEAFNRAWCLAERGGRLLTEGAGPDPFQARHDALRAEIEAYAARYRAAVAEDLARVQGIPSPRHVLRGAIVQRSTDLVELEAKLDELGRDADQAMRDQARDLRERLERDCVEAGLPIGLVRRRRARTPALPVARAIGP